MWSSEVNVEWRLWQDQDDETHAGMRPCDISALRADQTLWPVCLLDIRLEDISCILLEIKCLIPKIPKLLNHAASRKAFWNRKCRQHVKYCSWLCDFSTASLTDNKGRRSCLRLKVFVRPHSESQIVMSALDSFSFSGLPARDQAVNQWRLTCLIFISLVFSKTIVWKTLGLYRKGSILRTTTTTL